jgi:hypothetical protein
MKNKSIYNVTFQFIVVLMLLSCDGDFLFGYFPAHQWLDWISSHGRTIDEWFIVKDFEGSGRIKVLFMFAW